jgi:hypothetical protein
MKKFTDCRNNADRDKYGLCAAGIAECYEGCPFYMKQKTPTNADRIRSMNDMEMADELAYRFFHDDEIQMGIKILKWLQQPVKEEV